MTRIAAPVLAVLLVAAGDPAWAQRRRSPYIVRTGWTAGQPAYPFGHWVYDTLKCRKESP